MPLPTWVIGGSQLRVTFDNHEDRKRTEPPRMWFVCPELHQPSEAWMFRQLDGLTRFESQVISWSNNVGTPRTLAYPVHLLPTPYAVFDSKLDRLMRLPSTNFLAAVRSEQEILAQLVQATRPDVMFCQHGHCALRLLPVARRFGIPIVAQFNGFDASGLLRSRWYRWSLAGHLSSFTKVVVVAQYQYDNLLNASQTLEKDRLRLIPYGVPVDQFGSSEHVGDQPCRFLSVGRLVEKKAPLETIRAFSMCAAVCPRVTLTIIGDGPLRDEAEQLARSLGLTASVEFLGARPNDDVRRAMAAASVFLQHSVTAPNGDMEGWPVAVGEAAASGLPIVATRHAGIVDQVDEGRTGFLVDEHDWKAMGAAMIDLARNSELRRSFGAAARAKALTFSLSNQIAQLEDVLLSCARTNHENG